MRSRIPILLATSLILTAVGTAQQVSNTCLHRTLPVNVVPLDYVKEKIETRHFSIKLKNEELRVRKVVPATPQRVAILIDTSSSMLENSNKWENARFVILEVIKAAPAHVQIALYTFETYVHQLSDFTVNHDVLNQKLESLTFESLERRKPQHTAIMDSIHAVVLGDSKLAPGDVLYVISDGGYNSSHANDKKVIQDLVAREVRLYFFMLLSRSYAYDEVPLDYEDFAYQTGGGFITIESQYTMEFRFILSKDALAAISQQTRVLAFVMFNFYWVEFDLPRPITSATKLEITALDESNRKVKNVEVFYHHQLMPCSLQSTSR